MTSLTSCILFIFVFGAISIAAQQPCTDQTVQAVSSRGISIGKSFESVLSLFKSSPEEIQELKKNPPNWSQQVKFGGGYWAGSTRNAVAGPNYFDGISDYELYFLDGRLTGFAVTYSKPNWESQDQFINTLAEKFNLPKNELWVKVETRRELTCGNYKLTTNIGMGGSRFEISDLRRIGILEQRKKQAEAEQHQKDTATFKP